MASRDIWLFLFTAGLFAFNWPFTAMFSSRLPAYLFTAWGALIAAVYLLTARAPKNTGHGREGG